MSVAKLTGAKKKAFLERMAKGRRKAARGEPKAKKKATKKNPRTAPRKSAKKAAKAARPKRAPKKAAVKSTRPRKAAKKKNGSKLTGAKRKEFLERMAKGRRAAKRAGSKGVTRRPKKNSGKSRKRNSGLSDAEAMYETFHQKAPGSVREYELPYLYPENFAALGRLRELRVFLDNKNPDFPITRFGDCEVVCTPDGDNIYFVGGDQEIDLAALDMASHKDDVDLGPCVYICYHTVKGFHDFVPTDYYHQFGEENGVVPRLNYNRLNKRLYLVSGDYRVKAEGIVN